MKNRIITILAWGFFGIILVMSSISLVYGLPGNQELSKDILSYLSRIAWGLLPVVFAFVSALIISRRPQNVIGWLLMGPAIALANDGTSQAYFGSFTTPPASPSLVFLIALWFYSWSWLLLIFPIFFLLLLFPTGQAVSPRWRWVTRYVLGIVFLFFILLALADRIQPQNISWSVINPFGFVSASWLEQNGIPLLLVGLLSSTLLSASSIIIRYLRGTAIIREQIKWLLYACILFGANYIIAVLQNLQTEQWGMGGLVNIFIPISLMLMPVAIGIAILRYRLWDIDILIRRTLVYSLLTGLLGLVYFGGVALLQGVLTTDGRLPAAVSGPPSAVVIVLTTLAIAAIFNPLRRRLQETIDRRFYRQKYDSEKALAEFASVARNQADLEQVTYKLAQTTQDTLQPTITGIWIVKR